MHRAKTKNTFGKPLRTHSHAIQGCLIGRVDYSKGNWCQYDTRGQFSLIAAYPVEPHRPFDAEQDRYVMTEISKLTELRKLMQSMERTLGLEELSPVERDIYYAAEELSRNAEEVRTFGTDRAHAGSKRLTPDLFPCAEITGAKRVYVTKRQRQSGTVYRTCPQVTHD